MQHTITSITGDYEAQYGKRRVEFTVDGEHAGKKISGFFKFVPKVGDTLNGDIVQKGNYWNFVFSSNKAPAGGSVALEGLNRKLDAILTELGIIKGMLHQKDVPMTPVGEMDF